MSTVGTDLTGRVHHALVTGLLRNGRALARDEIAAALGTAAAAVDGALRQLAETHGVVLHPGTLAPWIVHPFALSPTAIWVETERAGLWAPCVWCALGVCALAGGAARIHTRIGGEAEDVDIDVLDGEPSAKADLLVHLAIPPRDAWQNVHHHCAMVLPFRSEGAIDAWAARHGLPRGQAVGLGRVAALARVWYGRHADPDWRKWTVDEAQEIFRSVGLTGPFWDLGPPATRAF